MEQRPVLKVVMAGGGTGGHLAPGLALAEAFHRHTPSDVTFFTTGTSTEQAFAEFHGHRQHAVASTTPRGGPLQLARFAFATLLGFAQSYRHLRRIRPDVLVALGGYGAFSPALAARSLGIPVVVLEQNAIPGRVTRALSRIATTVYTSLRLKPGYLAPRTRTVLAGNPVRASVLEGSRVEAHRIFGLDPAKKTVVVLGGSQGARAINDAFLRDLPHLLTYAKRVQFVLVTGKAEFPRVCSAVPRTGGTVRVVPFTTEMGHLLAAADLVVGRAGATTIAECTATCTPMALVPYPHAADGHQRANANAMVRAGAAVSFDQCHFDGIAWRVILDSIVRNESRLAQMSLAAAGAGHPDAAWRIADRIVAMLVRQSPKKSARRQWASSRRLALVRTRSTYTAGVIPVAGASQRRAAA